MILSELHDNVQDGVVRHTSALISKLWRQVIRGQLEWDGDELASVKRRLYDSQNSLGMCLMALNTYVSYSFHASPFSY